MLPWSSLCLAQRRAKPLLALRPVRGNEWAAGIAQGLNVVKVSVTDVRVEHAVKLMDFTKWLDRTGGSPREVSDRHRIRSILGMPVPR
jgi:hypothetical protein